MTMVALILKGHVVQVAAEPFDVNEGLLWVDCPDATVAGDSYDGSTFARPSVAPASTAPAGRVISSDAFRELFTPIQQSALWTVDPLLMAGMLKVITQGTANLDSPEASMLLSLAVAKGALSETEKERILSGTPPAATALPSSA